MCGKHPIFPFRSLSSGYGRNRTFVRFQPYSYDLSQLSEKSYLGSVYVASESAQLSESSYQSELSGLSEMVELFDLVFSTVLDMIRSFCRFYPDCLDMEGIGY